MTTDTLNEIGKKLHTTEIQMLRIEVPKHTVFDNDEVEEENNWRLDNLKILILSGSCCIKTNLMHNIFCHRNDQLKVLRINAYADLKNGLLHKIVTNYNNLTELAFGRNIVLINFNFFK